MPVSQAARFTCLWAGTVSVFTDSGDALVDSLLGSAVSAA